MSESDTKFEELFVEMEKLILNTAPALKREITILRNQEYNESMSNHEDIQKKELVLDDLRKIYTRFLDGLRELDNEEAILRVKEIIKKRRKLDINYARDLREANLGGPGETQLWWFEKWY